MFNKDECAVCGSKDVRETIVTQTIQEPYGSVEPYSYTVIECNNCKEGIVGNDHDTAILPALKRSQKTSAITIVKFFNDNGFTNMSLERILGLKFGSIEKHYLVADVVEPAFVMLLLTYRHHFPELFEEADIPGGYNRPKITEISQKDKE
ncbi:MAG: hypothetical protein Q7R33_00810 [Nitrosarchaeum sp.]|nr:hypothetical protein [Nitrosarchaeum sp.]